jgi:hypothetical protein
MANLEQYLDESFDDRSVKASSGIPDPVPPGDYLLEVEKTEVALTKDSTGALLKVTLSVVQGEHEGQKLFPQFNIRNKNMQAQQIGMGELKALAAACGVDYEVVRGDTDALLNIPFRAVVGMEKTQINATTGQPYPPRNNIKKYIPAGQAVAPVAAARPAAPVGTVAPAAMAKAGAPSAGLPWQK